MDWIAGLVVAVIVVALLIGLQRRRQARRMADEVGAPGVNVSPPAGFVSGVGAPNPAVPPPAVVPDQTRGIASSGPPPVRLTVCGLPALAWQHIELGPNSYQGTRFSLVVDAGVALPALHLFHHAGLLQRFAGAHGPSGIAALDEQYRMAGDLAAWVPILSTPVVQQALIRYPLDTFSVLGGRLTFASRYGVRLDADATSAISWVAATIIAAIPPQVTSPVPTGLSGTGSTDVDSVVLGVLAKSNLSPEQQQAMLALIRANQHH